MIFNINSYLFWLIAISIFCFLLERIIPWRKQNAVRPQLLQDFFWLIFNGYYLAVLFSPLFRFASETFGSLFHLLDLPSPESVNLVNTFPFFAQVIFLLVFQDFIEWCVHNLLHRIPALWELHKLHHSIHTMDWIGNFRFHWAEVFVYKSIKYLPLALMGFNGKALLAVAVFATLIGHLNHSNIPLSWGPLKYLFNSPKMHIWHHDVEMHLPYGQNFGIVLSVWDWLFGTAYMPAGQPEKIGFKSDEKFPDNLPARFVYPAGKLLRR